MAATRLPVEPTAIATARRDVAHAATEAGLDRDRIDDLMVAISEACTNALEAQQRAGASQPIEVSSRVLRGWLEVFVVDHGTGFDPASLPVRPPPSDPHHLDVERGWGIQLMRALVDELVYVSDEDGTALVLRCRITPR